MAFAQEEGYDFWKNFKDFFTKSQQETQPAPQQQGQGFMPLMSSPNQQMPNFMSNIQKFNDRLPIPQAGPTAPLRSQGSPMPQGSYAAQIQAFVDRFR